MTAVGINALSEKEAREFAENWLPAWSGNRPEYLASYYSEDCFYQDDQVPDGIRGRKNLTTYFSKLLADNPEWIWTQIEAIPMQGGFLNKWHASIPVRDEVVNCIGVCLVQLDLYGLIKRNEVYFDRTELVSKILSKA